MLNGGRRSSTVGIPNLSRPFSQKWGYVYQLSKQNYFHCMIQFSSSVSIFSQCTNTILLHETHHLDLVLNTRDPFLGVIIGGGDICTHSSQVTWLFAKKMTM